MKYRFIEQNAAYVSTRFVVGDIFNPDARIEIV